METDVEGKFVTVSFKKWSVNGSLVLGGTSLNHGPVSISWSVAFIGALWQLRDSSPVDSGTHVFEEKSLKMFFFCVCVTAFVGKTLTLTEKKELEVQPSLDHSLAHVRSLCW